MSHLQNNDISFWPIRASQSIQCWASHHLPLSRVILDITIFLKTTLNTAISILTDLDSGDINGDGRPSQTNKKTRVQNSNSFSLCLKRDTFCNLYTFLTLSFCKNSIWFYRRTYTNNQSHPRLNYITS